MKTMGERLGWKPSKSFDQALSELVDFFQSTTSHEQRVRMVRDGITSFLPQMGSGRRRQ